MRDYERGEILTSVHSAQGVDRSRITISGPIPSFNDLGELRRQFESDAEALANHLQARLPGGTLDALLRKLLERRALMLVVPLALRPRAEESQPEAGDSLDYQITGNWIYLRPARLLEMLECAADGVVTAPLEELLGVLSERAKEPLSSLDLWEGEALG